MTALMACSSAESQEAKNSKNPSPPQNQDNTKPNIKILDQAPDTTNEKQTIRETLLQSLQPSAKVGRIVISGPYALADWTDGPVGGPATLKKEAEGWKVMYHSTRGWPTDEQFAEERGMTLTEAKALLDQYAPDRPQ